LKAIYLYQLINVLDHAQYNNTISNCKFSNNSSPQGGSIYMFLPGDISLINCTFLNNMGAAAIYYEEQSIFFNIF